MNCTELRALLHGYVDGELDLVKSLEVEEHLRTCAACARLVANQQKLKAAFAQDGLRYAPDAGLQWRVMSALKKEQRKEPGAARPWLPWGGALAASLLAALVLWRVAPVGLSAQDALVAEVTSDHVRSLMANHLTDVLSTDQHTVKPWFDGKLAFAPPVTDFKDQGFPLVGGRLDFLAGHPVAAIVYQRRRHYVNVFVCPENPDLSTASFEASHDGYNLIHWNRSGMNFWAVSDLNTAELQNLVTLLQEQP
ncbi:MAG TPA: anti-sigma factor [Gammaproteobacteria bacterium]|nr:anti-sigma factor [Gammaproteobacteria bacterium]